MSLSDGYFALSAPDNKLSEAEERSDSPQLPELELSMTDEELLALKQEWEKNWAPSAAKLRAVQDQNENYWMGEQFGKGEGPIDNLIFESLETALPIMTRPKAEPLVESDNSEEGNALAGKVRKMLSYHADHLRINLKMKQVARFWAIYMVGVMKVGWSAKEDDITCASVRPQKLILDPEATIEECEYKGYYIGEKMSEKASDLLIRFPNKSTEIKAKVNNKLGTCIEYVMWTTDDYVFWTMDDHVLGKIKNPHWNYDTESEPQQSVDEFGNPIEIPGEPVPGKNHFNSPKKPYVFLSIFNLGKKPYDDTNLIQQNIPLQELVNKRLCQIDRNADNANTGIAVSGDAFTEEQAQKIAKLRRKGGVPWVPNGKPQDVLMDLPAQQLPVFVYESLVDYRNEIRNIFGTRGSSPQGTMREQTLGGKQIIRGQDQDRIGGGISTYLEQFSDNVFNWFVQLYYVYYDEPHYASVLGEERSKEYISLQSSELDRKLTVGVKEGSMIPNDPVNQRAEALELWTANALDPITLFERLEFPNPRESAKQLYLWQVDPIQLFPDLLAEQQQQEQMEQEAMAVAQQEMDEEQQADALVSQIDQEEQGETAHKRQLELAGAKQQI